MSKTDRTPIQREDDRRRVAELYLRQWTQVAIAAELGIDQSTVSRDLQAIQKQWRESAIVDMNEAKQRELARIDALELEYWQAWQRSQEDIVSSTSKHRGADKEDLRREELSLQKKQQDGDPRFLQGVQWCIEQRCKLLGINAPEKFDFAGNVTYRLTFRNSEGNDNS